MRALSQHQHSAPVARERLRALIAQDRAESDVSRLISVLRTEILAVIADHIRIGPETVRVRTARRRSPARMRIEIALPGTGNSAALN